MLLTEAQVKALELLQRNGLLTHGMGIRTSTILALRDKGAVSLTEYGSSKPMWEAALAEPNSCRICGNPESAHGMRIDGRHPGAHVHHMPTDEQRKLRMQFRGKARQK
jgi:hypothetical protein